jgi:hypothetical protein
MWYVWWGKEKHINSFGGRDLKEGDSLEVLNIDGRTIGK